MLERSVSESDREEYTAKPCRNHWVHLEYGVIVSGCSCFDRSLGEHIESGEQLQLPYMQLERDGVQFYGE